MTNWKTELNCNKCGQQLDLYKNSKIVTCGNCNKIYSLIVNEISYAVTESYSCDYFYFKDDNTIYSRYFNNPPLDTLEEAYQDTIDLKDSENNPSMLLNIVKKYHDALKMSVRRLIDLNPENLTTDQLNKVRIDNIGNPEKSLNIKTLFYFLELAFPHKKTEINNCFNKNEDMIKNIWWIRNKMEHILYSLWPINSNVYQDLKKIHLILILPKIL